MVQAKSRKKKVKRSKRKAKIETSSGGIVYLKRRGQVKVVLVGKFKPFVTWRLPKGHLEKNENLLEAARREVKEESGILGTGGPKLGTANFYFVHPVTKRFTHKYVHFFLFKKQSGSVEQHDKEYDAARWFTLDKAIKSATFKNDKIMLKRAARLIKRRQSGAPKKDSL